jgi:hypothetical protein
MQGINCNNKAFVISMTYQRMLSFHPNSITTVVVLFERPHSLSGDIPELDAIQS